MTTYQYVALDPVGQRKSGQIEAKDKDAAIENLLKDGRYVIEITERRAVSNPVTVATHRSVSKAELALMARLLADLSAAGLPLDRVLQVVSEQSESKRLAEVALSAMEDVRTGLPVSQALAKHPKLFPPLFTETLRAGEASGQFSEVAARLADFQETEVARKSQLTAAMIYPGVLTFTALSVVVFLLTFVIPRLSGIFQGMKDDLPITTKMLLGTANFLTGNYLALLGLLFMSIFLFRSWSRSETGGYARDKIILRMPIVGKVITKAVMSRYARVLGTLVFGGVPILEALRLAGLAAGNKVFQRTSEKVAEEVREGRPIHSAMEDSGEFPPVLTHMVAIGEETGDLSKMLNRVSDSLDFEVDNGMRRLMALVEPVIVLAMGGFVGFVVLSILLPIFQAQNTVK